MKPSINPPPELLKSCNRRAAWHNSRARSSGIPGRLTGLDIIFKIAMQGGLCLHCGGKLDLSKFEIDHLDPLSKGGENESYNVAVTCVHCNHTKSDRTIKQWIMILASKGYVHPLAFLVPGLMVQRSLFDNSAKDDKNSITVAA